MCVSVTDATLMAEALAEAERMGLSEVMLFTGHGPLEIVRLTAALGFMPFELVKDLPMGAGGIRNGILWKAPTDSSARALIKNRDPGEKN